MANLIKLFDNLLNKERKSIKIYGDLVLEDFHQAKHTNQERAEDLLFLAYKHQIPQLEQMLDQVIFNLNTLTMTIKYHISNTSGRWLINGKKYQELNPEEKSFFDEFLKQTKLESTLQKQ